MSNQVTVYPNSATMLMSHRVIDKTFSIVSGELNVVIGERLHTLKAGHSITIPSGTLYAYANLTPSETVMNEEIANSTFANDSVVHADVTGMLYDKNPAPATQSTYSLYNCLVDMLLPHVSLRSAA